MSDSVPVIPDGPGESWADPYGYAAYLLVENLLHELADRSVLDVDTVIDIVTAASEVEHETDRSKRNTAAKPLYSSSEILALLIRTMELKRCSGSAEHRT